MAMTKKDYEAIAETIAVCVPTRLGSGDFDSGYIYGRNVALADMVDELVERFSKANPRFDEAIFREACGL